MRLNSTKQKVLAGKTAYGVFLPLNSPTIVEMLGYLSFDFVIPHRKGVRG